MVSIRCTKCGEKLDEQWFLKKAARLLISLTETREGRDRIAELIPPDVAKTLAASFTSRLRAVKKGNAPVFRPCRFCGALFGARDMRLHIPRCPSR